jgi:hypothetical protein
MKKLIPFVLSAILLLSGCSSDKAGNFRIYLTDQPIPNAEKVLVTISEIRVQKTQEAFITVWNGTQDYDLLQLRNTEKLILDTELEEGMYTQIRLDVTTGQVVINGTSHTMIVPSSEVKIPVVFNILKGGVTEIVLDFEAEHSIEVVKAGLSDQYILRPVIRVKSVTY